MSKLSVVDPRVIRKVVGVPRHPDLHIVRLVSDEEQVYIMHSEECFNTRSDLRGCEFSQSLDRNGIDKRRWKGSIDQPVVVELVDGKLVPTYAMEEDVSE